MAQQEAEKARYLVEKAEQMKIAAITTAEGDAQAAKLLAKVGGPLCKKWTIILPIVRIMFTSNDDVEDVVSKSGIICVELSRLFSLF